MIEPTMPDAAGYSGEAPAPQPAAPTQGPWQPGQYREMSPDDAQKWKARIDRAEQKGKTFHPQWKRGTERYAKAVVTEKLTEVDALLDFRHVEGKKSQLFFKTGEVTFIPRDPQDQMVPAIQVLPGRQKLFNYEIGPDGANAKRTMHKTLIDTIGGSGFMITEMGFEQSSLPVETMQPGMLGQPATPMTVQVPIWSKRFWEPISPMKLLIPEEHIDSSNFDAASWLGRKGTMSVSKMRKLKWKIPADYEGNTQKDEAVYEHGESQVGNSENVGAYTRIWYRAYEFDETVFHPELYRCIIFVDGIEEPVWHIDSPFQTLTPQGQLTDDSMIGCPIHVGTIRDLTDSAYVPSDLVRGEQLSTELNQFRTDLIFNRKSRRNRVLISDGLGPDIITAITKNEGAVPVPAGTITDGGNQNAVSVVQTGTEPRDNYTAQEVIERDHTEAFGQGSNQRGQTNLKKTTATESRIVQGNSAARAGTEQARVREYFIAGCRKFDSLVQRTMSQQDVVKILGQQGAAVWAQWKQLPGRYTYDILPDSGLYVDASEYQAKTVDLYNMCRKDDRVSTDELLTMLARAYNRDPAKFIAPPSGKTMDPPKPSISFKVEELHDPVGGKLFIELLKAGGVKVTPELEALVMAAGMVALAAGTVGGNNPDGSPVDAPHGGMADQTEPINKHQRQNTGKVQGSVQ